MQALEVSSDRKQESLQRLLLKESGRVLVFARTKRGTEKLAKNLVREGFTAAMIHGNRSQSQRNAALAGFQQGRYRILVATDVASRGIHVQDIAHVINYDLPDGAESFIHRAGRTGRAGLSGVATTLFGREQRSELMQLERTLGIQMERVRDGGDSTDKLDRHQSRIPASQPIYARKASASHGTARVESRSTMRMDRLPGEFLQAQIEG
jgi:ATP-dependent RNA helicase RhlE